MEFFQKFLKQNSKTFPTEVDFETRAVVGTGANGVQAAIVPFFRADLYNISVSTSSGSVGGYMAINRYCFGFYFDTAPKVDFVIVNVRATKK